MQTRSIQCLRHGRPSSGCLTYHRPISSRACNTHFCPAPGLAPGPALKGTNTWLLFHNQSLISTVPESQTSKILITIVTEYHSVIFIAFYIFIIDFCIVTIIPKKPITKDCYSLVSH